MHEITGYAPFQLMFGRIPMLPVDIMFGQVLHDPVIIDHGSYVKALMSYLHEAAHNAQRLTEKEQRKQARCYNRKVKGACLNIGDRVLLANKSERGKKKLVDKWDPTVYTVKDQNLQTNIYKLIDDESKTKVVHRNLILDISFLPVEPSQDDRDIQSNGEDVENESCAFELSDSLEEESSDDRTRAWVLDDQVEIKGQEFMEDVLESDHSVQSGRNVCHHGSSENQAVRGSDQVSGIETESSVGNLDPQIETVHDSCTPSIPEAQAQISTDTSGVRTSAGRVFKKVSRLIELMTQKPFYGHRGGHRLQGDQEHFFLYFKGV